MRGLIAIDNFTELPGARVSVRAHPHAYPLRPCAKRAALPVPNNRVIQSSDWLSS